MIYIKFIFKWKVDALLNKYERWDLIWNNVISFFLINDLLLIHSPKTNQKYNKKYYDKII
jgi:hypothetical protein